MRLRALRVLGLSVGCLALATSLAIPARAATPPSGAATDRGAVVARATCYSNLDDVGTFGTMSQNFAPILDQYDSAAADDVTLEKRCTVKSIQVTGSYTTADAVDSETVTFYKDKDGRPGKVVSAQTKVGADSAGSYDIKLKPVTLRKGTYWISVVANLDSQAGGQWYWTSSNTQKGAAALWENPRGGWQYGCTTWTKIYYCLGAGPGPDLLFSLSE